MERMTEHPAPSPDDASLVVAIAHGDKAAFATLYERYFDAVHAHCFRLSGSSVVADDLTAMVFLECWRRRSEFRLVEGSARPWLHGVAFNVIRNYWRMTRRYRAALERLLARSRSEFAAPDSTDQVVDRVAAEQRIRAVRRALASLPKRERDVIEVCVAGDLGHEEAAVMLGIPVGTLKSRLARGLARLRATDEVGRQRAEVQ